MMASSDQVLTVRWPVVIKCWLSDDGQQWSSVDCQMMASDQVLTVNDGQMASDQVLTVNDGQ